MTSARERRFRTIAQEATPIVGAYLQRRIYPLSQSDVDDLVEETLIIAWRRLDDIPEEAPIAWMVGVARNVLRNAQRKVRRGERALQRTRVTSMSASAEDQVVADEAVRTALAHLSDDDREIITLSAWDGLSGADIARIYGISVNAAAVRLSRAHERFRAHLALVVEV
jgi:RNA polymerase sigma-70 factor (ECF subfamily)